MQDKGKAKGMKRSQPRRDWTEARAKVEDEGRCRLYRHDLGCMGSLEAAHIIGRENDRYPTSERLRPWQVDPMRIVPLCRHHHHLYDAHEIDLLGALLTGEEIQAIRDAGSLESARRRLAPNLYRQERETDAA